MITKEAIKEVAEVKINEIGGFFVDLKVNTANVITLFFDRNAGVEVKHCLEVSKYIEEHFDRNIEDYELNVCSAGLDRPFMVEQQYHKYKRKEVGVLRTDGKRFKGVISSYVNDVLNLQIIKKKKGNKREKVFEKVEIPKSEIKETKLKINFK